MFVDHFTRYTWLYPLKQKSHVHEVFVKFKALVGNQFQSKLRTLYTDNGGEYIALAKFLSSHGISHFTTPPHTPEHNGIAERRHRHIVETGLALLSHASMPKSYWTYALSTAVYLINRMPTPVLSLKTPHECLFGTSPNFQKLKVFGCLCFPWLKPYAKHKLDPRSTPCVFLGYSPTQSAYFCLDRTTSRIYTSRHVVFHEYVFPFSMPVPLTSNVSSVDEVLQTPADSFTVTSLHSNNAHGSPATNQSLPSEVPVPTAPLPPDQQHTTSSTAPATATTSAPPVVPAIPDATPEPTGAHQSPTPQTAAQPAQPRRASNRNRKPVQNLNLTDTVVPLSETIPTSVAEALNDPRWRQAMYEELEALARNRTWDLIDASVAANIVGCKWVFTIKRHPDGSIDRFKAHLVAKGFHQRPGVDFQETFSPVIKPATIRLVLSVSVSHNWQLRQLDVNNAFLQGQLDEEVFMSQPPGFKDKTQPLAVCKLHKAIYGLKQAPRAWYKELCTFLLHSGFTNSLADASLFIYNETGTLIYLLVYVDDIIITGNNNTVVNTVIQSLSTRLSLKDLGFLFYFLGIEVSRTKHGLSLNQHRYIADILHKTKMTTATPATTPMCATTPLTLHTGTPLPDPTEYRATVGSLQYLSLTRRDISYAVNKLSQYMHRPTTDHWTAVKRILRYLVGTHTNGLFFSTQNTPSLHAFTDADWAGDKDDYMSTGAYLVYYGSHPIAWSSKKQSGIARSSTEAEYRSVANTTAEVTWIKSLLTELGIKTTTAPAIYCDNKGATYLCANPMFHSRMKHLALDYHFVRNHVQAGNIRVSHIHSSDQLADALTKPLSRPLFHTLRVKIGLATPRPS